MFRVNRDKASEGDIEAEADPSYLASQAPPRERRHGSRESLPAPEETGSGDEYYHDAPSISNDLNQNLPEESKQHNQGQNDPETQEDRSLDHRARVVSDEAQYGSGHVDDRPSTAENAYGGHPSAASRRAAESDIKQRKQYLERRIEYLSHVLEERRREHGDRTRPIEDQRTAYQHQQNPGPPPPPSTDFRDFALETPDIHGE